MNPKLLKGLVAVVIIAVAFFLIKSFMGTSTNSTISADPNTTKFVDDRNIVALLGRLEKVKLDDSIFANSVFMSLINFERPIDQEAVGRRNPFAPIGADGIAPARPATTTSIVR